MDNIKTIFLDWDGTLSNNVFWESLRQPKTKYMFDKINYSLLETNKNLLDLWMRNKLDFNDIIDVVHKDTKIKKTILKNELILSSKNGCFVDNKIPSIIKQIQNNGINVILSSDNMDVFDFTISSLKLNKLFDDILVSYRLGFLKKDICDKKLLFFEDYIKTNNLAYNECVLIDNSKNLSKICKKVGMNNILVKNINDITNILKQFIKK